MSQIILETSVDSDWVDYNGHMNDGEYARVFSYAVDAFMAGLGLDNAMRDVSGVTMFTLETHLCYLQQAREAEPLTVRIDILDRDAKRVHAFFHMHSGERLIATSEQMLMAMDRASEHSTRFPADILRALESTASLPRAEWPVQAGQAIGIRRR